MKLAELEPQFIRHKPDGWTDVATLAEAQGVHFLCPLGCGHIVLCWFRDRGVPDAETPGPGRWAASGAGFEDLTLSPSIHLTGPGCGWHGFVTAGQVTSC